MRGVRRAYRIVPQQQPVTNDIGVERGMLGNATTAHQRRDERRQYLPRPHARSIEPSALETSTPRSKNARPERVKNADSRAMDADARFAELGLQLPPAPKPVGVYKPIVVVGNLAYLSGHGPLQADKSLITGK